MALSKIDADGLNIGQIGGRRNLIINGAMQVAQRGTSAITLSNAESFSVDRFKARNQSNSGDNTVQQVSDAPVGVGSYSLKWTTGTADTAGSTDNNYVTQYIEGSNVQHLKFGTSDAQTLTLSFYVKSSLTGTFGGSLSNDTSNFDRGFPFTYSISSANTWERKSITISGDTTGTWTVTTTGGALLLWFDMGMGSSYRGTAGSWASGRLQGATGATDVIGTSGATWQITGVQLEVGDTATPFEHRSYGEELALCQRYFCKIKHDGSYRNNICLICNHNDVTHYGIYHFPVTMRSAPTGTVLTGTYRAYPGGAATNFSESDVSMNIFSPESVRVGLASSAGAVGDTSWLECYLSGAGLLFDAEL